LPPSIFALLQAEKDQIPPQEEVDLRKVLQESLQSHGHLFGCLIDGHRLDIGNPKAYLSSLQVIANDDTGVYQPSVGSSAEVWELQVQDEILQSVRSLQELEKNVHIPATLHHALFRRDGAVCSSAGEIHISSSPGRMDLMCGFADHSGSYAIQHPTAERLVSLAVVEDNTNIQSGGRGQGMIRLACIQVEKLSELSRAIATGDFKVRETAFPTGELFTTAGRLKSDADLRTALSEKFTPVDAPDLWELYLTGIIHRIYQQCSTQTKFPTGKDFTVVTVSDLPWNTGLASSAAVEVATAISLGKALQLPAKMLEPVSVSMLCKEVENRVVGAPCDILDQLAVTHPGARTIEHPLVGIRCRMPFEDMPTYSLPLPQGVSVIALESGVKRSTVSTAYHSVRDSAIVGKAILEASAGKEIQYLCDMTPSQFAKYEDQLPETMSGSEIHAQFPGLLTQTDFSDKESSSTYQVRAATRFPIEENHRVQVFQDVLRGLHNCAIPRESGLRVLGELMAQTHAGYSKCGLDTDATAFLVDAMRNSGAIGAKISGGGGGGAVVALVNDSFLRNASQFEQLQERYHTSTGLTCKLRRGTSGPAKYHGALRRQFSTIRCTDGHDHLKPRVLVVNHGYPPDFNGGSEVYAQMVALQLKNSGQCDSVHVFAREHDPYRPDFEIRRTVDQLDSELPVFRMNYSREAPYFRFMAKEVDDAYKEVVEIVKPDIVHLHHMNHLSLNLPFVAKAAGAKVLYTLHDYWLMCPRGQFLQTGAARNDPWKLCDGQENGKCAERCYTSRYARGVYNTSTGQSDDDELRYWTSWIASRMDATRNACEYIDAFIAPSQYLRNKYVNDFSLPADKIIVEPYGFFRDRLKNRKHRLEDPATSNPIQNTDPYVFAYTGRHQPGKGINLLVEAALKVLQNTNNSDSCSNEDIPFRVKIFGRQDANSSPSLQRKISECPDPRAHDIFSWEAEYVNMDIVDRVFNAIDCLVVPSIWEENSPLVIHEAQQCGVPVITSSYGGMGELVKDAINGLTFHHRSADSLAEAMEKAIEQPAGMRYLGERGYIYSPDGQVPCIERHTETLLQLFETMRSKNSQRGIAKAASSSWYTARHTKINPEAAKVVANAPDSTRESKPHSIEPLPAPWRVTFDTNPDDCNFSCTMCEQHSEFSPHQRRRREQHIRKRRMDIDIIRKTVADLSPKGLREIIPSTMGEPLYYKHFPEILKLCAEHGVKLNLTTNGSFYGRGVEYWAEKIIPVGSDVKISWNGITQATQEKIMKGSNLDEQIENLRKFVKIRNTVAQQNGGNYCSVTLQLTFMEVNLQELPELVKFAIEEDCDRVKGHHLWAHFPEIKNENLRRNKESIRRWNAIASECREIALTHNRPSGKPFRLENFFDLDASRESEGAVGDPKFVCPFLGREAWVNHSGRFDPCCAPDEQRLSLGSFGNITDPETRLLDIWNSDQYNNLVQNYTKRPLCRKCNMRRPLEEKIYNTIKKKKPQLEVKNAG
jgi:galactokinase/glycosyltransferase involved in cell wall biosynthesis/MoaA/NifB/PqqE/SkfB family radical SAM enzyme